MGFTRLAFRTALLSLCLGLVALPPASAQPITIKFSHVTMRDSPKGQAADFFAARVAELTGGQIVVEVFPDGTLYNDREELDALRRGDVQMLAPSLSKFGALGLTAFEVFDLPYLFSDYQTLHKITRGPIGKNILEKLDGYGIVGLGFWDNGFKSFSSNFPIEKPADMKGRRFRIQPSDVLSEQMKDLGAIPQVLPFSETFDALASGKVEGTENTPTVLYSSTMNTVQSHLILTEHGYLGYAVVINKEFWMRLSAHHREQVMIALEQATSMANQTASKENERALRTIESTGKTEVLRPTPGQRLAFKRALMPVHKKMGRRIGEKLLESIYQEIGFDPDSLDSKPEKTSSWLKSLF